MADFGDMQVRCDPSETFPETGRQNYSEVLLKYANARSAVYRFYQNELSQPFRQLVEYAGVLADTVKKLKKTNQVLRDSCMDTIHRLVITAEFKDINTGRRLERLTRYAQINVSILAGCAQCRSGDADA